MVCYAKVAVSVALYSIDKPYVYLVPEEFKITSGIRVFVPFSKANRIVEGIVLSTYQGELLPKIKYISAILDESPIIDDNAIKLAIWMREQYFCTSYSAIKTMLPTGMFYSNKEILAFNNISYEQALSLCEKSQQQQKILEIIYNNGGTISRDKLAELSDIKNLSAILNRLVIEKKVLQRSLSQTKKASDKTEKIAYLNYSFEDALSGIKKNARSQVNVIKFIDENKAVSVKDIRYFTGAAMSTINKLEKSGIISLFEREVYRRPKIDVKSIKAKPRLNAEQTLAYNGLVKLADDNKPYCALLYGVTGSGKTQVYISLIHYVLEKGKKAIMLVPEIALTPQLLQHFSSQFGDDIAILHSALSVSERYDEWKRIRNGKANVVIGTRSAIFAPLDNIGLIILDEEQEGSYRSEKDPRYNTLDIAKYRSVQNNALVLLGSATPSIESMYYAQIGVYKLFTLRKRYNQRALPDVKIVDMRSELMKANNTNISSVLYSELEQNIKLGQQSVLFLNRRGTSRMVLCVSCGKSPDCPNCSVKLTYHKDNKRLMCHHCGYSQILPKSCPYCGGELIFVDAGVQMIQEQLENHFPGIQIARMDADSVSASNTHSDILSKFDKGNIPILLGTQMVAKGLDFENVTLVGVIDADQGLYVDSFRATERTFSLLTQVVGRAGRGEHLGRAVIQTFTPQNDTILFASRQDYDSFFKNECNFRHLKNLPPFTDLYRFTLSGTEDKNVQNSAILLKNVLIDWQNNPDMALEQMQIFGPAEAKILRVMGRYRYNLTLVCKNNRKIRNMIAFIIKAFQSDKNNKGVYISADLNPVD